MMKRWGLCIAAVGAMLAGTVVHAQEIVGDWQGTLRASKNVRFVMRVSKDQEQLKATLYSIDQKGEAVSASSVSLQEKTFKFTIEQIDASYEGTLSDGGQIILGMWKRGGDLIPLNLVRPTKETAWTIPDAVAPPKAMAADARPSFNVVAIQANDSGVRQLQGVTINGRNFAVTNGSLNDLIAFAYDVQIKQISNAPEWMATDRYDITAVPDQEGMPSMSQVKEMLQKLLTERFKLTLHHETKAMSAYVLTAGKEAERLAPSQASNGVLPSMSTRPVPGGLSLQMVNATTRDFTGFLQTLVLDRPVVDKTGIAGRFDFTIKFTPDNTQFGGHPPQGLDPAGVGAVAPGLVDAIQQQIGLKLVAEKTGVDTIVVDHVEKPSPGNL